MRYSVVIDEIKRLIEQAKCLRLSRQMHMDPDFRRWRHELETLLAQANDRFSLPGQVRVHVRRFGQSDRILTDDDELFERYVLEMNDTIIELETIVDAYQKFGEPKDPRQSDSKPREWPAKITLSWLSQNAPLSLWGWLVSILLAAFVLGTQVGQSTLYKQMRDAIVSSPDVKR